ncbi:MAG: hypothetical protein JXR31_05050, partial [Prolixibacteraceae bacterium]|nr:hypothetical protein [Prolixibacteraceae bacterium]MBN2773593.1 hypothetical protein [Prolixibacteraceae bacterium]
MTNKSKKPKNPQKLINFNVSQTILKIKNFKITTYLVLILIFFFASIHQSDAQTISTGHPTQNFTVGSSAVVLAPSLTITSSSNLVSASVSIQSYQSGDYLDATNPQGLSESWNSSTKTLTLSGSASASVYQAALRTVTFRTTTAIAGTRSIDFILGSAVSYTINGKQHIYEVIYNGGSITWQQAKANAAARTFGGQTGYLATITSSGENSFIINKVSQNSWIGASDDTYYTDDNEGEWYWVTGPESGTKFWTGGQYGYALSYQHWYTGEPNNAGGENFGHVYGSGAGPTGYWNDFSNSNGGVSYYIVEYGGYSTSPATFDVSDYANVNVSINRAPVAYNDGIYYVNNGQAVSGNVLANDYDPDGNDIDVAGIPYLSRGSFNSFNTETGVFEYLAPTNWIGTFTFSYSAADGSLSDNAIATIVVSDATDPVALTKNITVELNSEGAAVITANQIDNGSSDNIGITSRELNISTFNCEDVGENTVILTVRDAAGNSDSESAIVTVEDNIQPVVITKNITIQLDVNGQASIAENAVDNGSTDACGIASYDTDINSFDCSDVGNNTVTLTVTDV